MKICTVAHHVPTFGEIPAGSLWDDDSPFVLGDYADHFADVDEDAPPVKAKKATRKFGEKPAPAAEPED